VPLVERDHVPDFPLRDQVHRHRPKAGREQPVKGRRGASPLEVPQDGDPHVPLTHPA
jgi:hypothetical protein